MRRFLTILLTTLALTAALCVSASASSFDGAAEDLSKIGMLKGSADGFNLDQAPTRAQAAIMLVRLYGAELEAQNTYRSGRITCPFTDVNETAAPYVAWLVDEGLANGTSETTFGAAEPCTARAYTIFLLRALGYQDNTDFTPATAQDFAASLGLLDTSALTGTFLRDDLAALTYQALATDLKDGSTYLLDSLIKNEAIDINVASTVVEKIENYRAIMAASNSTKEGFAATMEMNMAVTVSNTAAGSTQPSGQIEQTQMNGKGEIRMILNRNPQMAFDFTVNMDGEEETVKMWLRNGQLYVQAGEESYRTEMPAEFEELMTSGTQMNSGASMLPFVESVTKKASGSDMVYTLQLNSAMGDMINGIMAQVLAVSGQTEGLSAMDMNIDGFTMTYTVRNNVLRAASADAAMSVSMDLGEGAKSTVGMVLTVKMDVSATGSAVKINFPSDLNSFEEIIGGADGATGIWGKAA